MILRNLLYIFQGENYDSRRLIRYAYRNVRWWQLEQRGQLVMTLKIRLLFVVTIFELLVLTFLAFWYIQWYAFIVVGVEIIGLPFLIVFAWWLLLPFDRYLRQKRFVRARSIVEQSGATVIGITGSYGKTTTKEILCAILLSKYTVLKTPENVNTDIGVAEFIIAHAAELQRSRYFIVEMGAYRRGDIASTCKIVQPTFAILTGITTAHLDRFGSLANIIQAKFELPKAARGTVYLNGDDLNVVSHYQEFEIKDSVVVTRAETTAIMFLDHFAGLTFEYEKQHFESRFLASHAVTEIVLCIRLAEKLGVTVDAIQRAVKSIAPIQHRLELLYNSAKNIYIIDDSYNGNYQGFLSGLEVLQRAPGRRIVLTPGLVELGSESKKVHEELAERYIRSVDLLLLIDTSATRFIVQRLRQLHFSAVKVYPSANAAHADLGSILQQNDTILFQNDWSDIHL